MLVYWKGFSGGRLLAQIHGSALYRASLPGLLSSCVYLLLVHYSPSQLKLELDHPYAIGVLISGVMLMLVFRSNHSYQRYWDACGSVQKMLSKWLDATVHTAACHMQCKHYDKIRPISTMEMSEESPFSININGKKQNGHSSKGTYFRSHSKTECSITGNGSVTRTNKSNNPPQRQRPQLERRCSIDLSAFDVMNDYEDTLLTNIPNTVRSDRLDGGWGLLRNTSNYNQTVIPTASWVRK